MIIRNFLEMPGKMQSIHAGKGQGKNVRVFDQTDFDTPLNFINHVELEPGASIGVHYLKQARLGTWNREYIDATAPTICV